jgi:Family of unknown function (DUF6505)
VLIRGYSRGSGQASLRVKLLKTVRADISDTFVFDKAAEPGEWAISGALLFANLDPATLSGKRRTAFRSGFLGIGSFGWSTLVQVVEVSEEQRSTAVEQLAARLLERCGAPDLATARAAAEEEIVFAASLCEHDPGMLVAVSRRYDNEAIRESFRTLQTNSCAKPAPVFSFVEVIGEEAAPPEHIDLVELVDRARE